MRAVGRLAEYADRLRRRMRRQDVSSSVSMGLDLTARSRRTASGRANMVLGGGEKIVNFIYLVYRPSQELLAFVDNPSDKQRIQELFDDEKEMAKTIDFKSIYEAILHYFNRRRKYGYSEEEIRTFATSFSFTFCTQDNFKSVVDNL